MKAASPRIRSLLRQARKTADAGKREAAQQLYEQILEEAPGTVEAWLGLAEVAPDSAARRTAYERVLALDPNNKRAQQALQSTTKPAPAADNKASEAPEPDEPEADALKQTKKWLEEATRRLEWDGTERRQVEATVTATKEASRVPEDVPAVKEGVPALAEDEMDDHVLYCYRHPDRETGLRCYTCNRPICMRCAHHTPVGYRCPQCIREAQDVFFGAGKLDYVLAGVVTLILSLLAGAFIPRLGFFVIFLGPAAGTLIGRAAFRAARRHHGRYLPQVVAGLAAVGALLPSVLPLLMALLFSSASLASLGFGLLWPIIFVFLATGAAYYQVK